MRPQLIHQVNAETEFWRQNHALQVRMMQPEIGRADVLKRKRNRKQEQKENNMAIISISIDVTLLDKDRLVTGKPQPRTNGDGSEIMVAPKYLDLTLIETPNSLYEHTHMVVQSLSKEERERGDKGPILGNAKTFGTDGGRTEDAPRVPSPLAGGTQAGEELKSNVMPVEDEIPF